MIAQIDDIAEIDYSLVSKPTFQGSINMANKVGKHYGKSKRVSVPMLIVVDVDILMHLVR